MKILTHIVIVTILLFGQLFGPTSTFSQTISLVADDWPPFNGTPNSEREGFLLEVARTVFEKRGIEIVYEILPWRRAVEMTREGIYNGLVGASKTDAPDFVFPTEELSRNLIAFYVQKESPWRFERRSDIENISLGVIAGYDYRKWLLDYIDLHQDNEDRVQVMTGDNPLKRNLLKLIDGRVDAIVDNEAVILDVSRKMNVSDQIRLAGYGTEPASIYIAFSPALTNSKQYAEMLSQGIHELRETGMLKQILSKYGLSDWKQSQ